MRSPGKVVVILIVLLLELAWVVRPVVSHGDVLEVSYRREERLDLQWAWVRDRSQESKARYDSEVRLLERHIARRDSLFVAVALMANAFGIYWFWRCVPDGGPG